MQIPRLLLSICVVGFGLAALSIRADDNQTQAATPAAESSKTTASKAELKKQAEANARARKEADKQAKAAAKAQKQAATNAKSAQGKPEKSATTAHEEKKPAAFKPIERPPLPISADKAQRLTELLRKYKADDITPEQYQKERAKILAEP
jgi:hypothetical protein